MWGKFYVPGNQAAQPTTDDEFDNVLSNQIALNSQRIAAEKHATTKVFDQKVLEHIDSKLEAFEPDVVDKKLLETKTKLEEQL